jgi:ABC-type transport system substrate-binding protein
MTSQQRRRLMQAAAAWTGGALVRPRLAEAAQRQAGPKVLRVAFETAETGFDPAQLFDSYSFQVTSAIFEAPLAWDYLARPFRLVPLTAAALPEVSSDYRVFTLRIRPGIHFADDPAFKGVRRELTAADYVYSLKRAFDPRLANGYAMQGLQGFKILGLDALRQQALDTKRPFDYDRPVEGLRALDRYTLQIRLAEPAPRFAYDALAFSGAYGAVAREVVEHYGATIAEHPVGTGAFRLAEWRRSSRIVLERNPGYREVRYDAQPDADDVEGQAIAARLAGRRLPMIDRVEISIIEESQPRWLAFLEGDLDRLILPNEFAPLAAPGNALAPFLARQGVQLLRTPVPTVSYLMFNMDDPIVGGYTPEKVALRRAISLAYDVDEEIRLLRNGQAVPAYGPVAPLGFGYAESLVGELSEYDPAKANALLDLYGYADRDGDGWRERPDGSRLVLEKMTEPDLRSRRFEEMLQRRLAAVGLRVAFKVAQWPENNKAARAGRFMMWTLGSGTSNPDSDAILALAYGPNKTSAAGARFELEA